MVAKIIARAPWDPTRAAVVSSRRSAYHWCRVTTLRIIPLHAPLFSKIQGLPFQGNFVQHMRRMRYLAAVCALTLASALAQGQATQSAPDSGKPATQTELPADKPATPVVPKPPVERKLVPADEGASDPTWTTFRTNLLAALQRGDRTALINTIDRNIINGLEVPPGVAEFRKLWEIDGKSDRVLRDLSASLSLGSAWHQQNPKNKGARVLCAPYVPIKWPLQDVDPYDSGAIVVKEVLIKGAPSHAAQTLGTLSFDIVGVRDWEVADSESQLKQRWVKVLHRGREGYVPEEHIRSAIEHRACFAKAGNTWRMVEYVVGIEFLGGD